MTDWIGESRNWYRGNLHMHTTLSDGVLPPQEAIVLYRSAGYDFLALTDHWHQSEPGQVDGMLLLPGCEFDTGDMVHSAVYHIVGVGMKKPVDLQRNPSRPPQQIIDAVTAAGGAAILAHPAWSLTNPEDVLQLSGLIGAEIYNTVSGLPWNARPDSSLYFDLWAGRGLLMPCMAADDCHFYRGEQTRSYIMAGADTLEPDSILRALRQGRFYASQGPRFHSVRLENGRVNVDCTRAGAVVFYSNTVWCADRVTRGPVTQASYTVKETDRYIRVEILDEAGNRAWTSPFPVEDSK